MIGSAQIGPMGARSQADLITTAIALLNTEFWTWTRKRMMQLSKRLGCKGVSETVCRFHKNTPTQNVVSISFACLCYCDQLEVLHGVCSRSERRVRSLIAWISR